MKYTKEARIVKARFAPVAQGAGGRHARLLWGLLKRTPFLSSRVSTALRGRDVAISILVAVTTLRLPRYDVSPDGGPSPLAMTTSGGFSIQQWAAVLVGRIQPRFGRIRHYSSGEALHDRRVARPVILGESGGSTCGGCSLSRMLSPALRMEA